VLGIGIQEVIPSYGWNAAGVGGNSKSFESFNTLWVKLSTSRNIDEE
jgi:hypothetical protein